MAKNLLSFQVSYAIPRELSADSSAAAGPFSRVEGSQFGVSVVVSRSTVGEASRVSERVAEFVSQDSASKWFNRAMDRMFSVG
jgi:hypothetical protein